MNLAYYLTGKENLTSHCSVPERLNRKIFIDGVKKIIKPSKTALSCDLIHVSALRSLLLIVQYEDEGTETMGIVNIETQQFAACINYFSLAFSSYIDTCLIFFNIIP